MPRILHQYNLTHDICLSTIHLLIRFSLQLGLTGSVLYNCSLSVYFVSVIKFGMNERDFKRKIELWCHFIPNAFAIGTSIFLQAGGYFNPLGGESSERELIVCLPINASLSDIFEKKNRSGVHCVLTLLLSLSLSLNSNAHFSNSLLQMLRGAGHLLYRSNASLILTSTALGAERKLWCTGNGWDT